MSGTSLGLLSRVVVKLRLNFGELEVSLTLCERIVEGDGGPYLDWLVCTVDVRDPHFAGQFQWEVMPNELLQLADGLERLHSDAFSSTKPFVFRCAETNVALDFEPGALGTITVSYRLGGPLADDSRLQGEASLEPSVALRLAGATRDFVRDAKSGEA